MARIALRRFILMNFYHGMCIFATCQPAYMETRHIQIKDYNYPLPDERIAKFPIANRDHSRLLVYRHGEVTQDMFYNITHYLPKGSLMVCNNTKVIQARLHFRKDTGALIEIFLLEPCVPADYERMFVSRGSCSWICLVGNLKKWKGGTLSRVVRVHDRDVTVSASRADAVHTGHRIDISWDDDTLTFADLLDAVGELPIPPYLNRDTVESDKVTYQTVYSKIKGSVAAPTAGLHFTPEVLSAIDACDIDREEVTLHVGAGTFKPVKAEEIEGHEMHTEYICVSRRVLQSLLDHDVSAIAVGTTSVRTLESLYYIGVRLEAGLDLSEDELHVNQWEPYDNAAARDVTPRRAIENILAYLDSHDLDALHTSTQIIIAPGYDYKIVKMLVTNFHQPQSTLLLLVSAFVNGDWRKIYDYALANDFRFLSYGDSSLLIP